MNGPDSAAWQQITASVRVRNSSEQLRVAINPSIWERTAIQERLTRRAGTKNVVVKRIFGG